MKLTFTCNHCEKENEIIISTMTLKKEVENKKYNVVYYNKYLKKWTVSEATYNTLTEFYLTNETMLDRKAFLLES